MTDQNTNIQQQKWYYSTWFIIVTSVFCFPVGLLLLWTNKAQEGLFADKKAKIILTVIVGVLILIGMSSRDSKNSVSKGNILVTDPSAPPINLPKVTASKLFEDYQANEIAADEVYKGKEFEITGTVTGIDKILGNMLVKLATSNRFLSLSLEFGEEYKSDLASLKKGISIRAKCEIRGKTIGVRAENCQLIK